MGDKNLDSQFAETQNITVRSRQKFYRYRKRFKQQDTTKGRKQARFHTKDKDLTAGTRRD